MLTLKMKGFLVCLVIALSSVSQASLNSGCMYKCDVELKNMRDLEADMTVLSPETKLTALRGLSGMAQKTSFKEVAKNALDSIKPLLTDIQDEVRVEAMNSIQSIANIHSDEEVEQKAIDLLNLTIKGSWKVEKVTRIKAIDTVLSIATQSRSEQTKSFALIVLKHYKNSSNSDVAYHSRAAVKELLQNM